MKKIYALLFTLSMTTVSVQAAIKHKIKSGETLSSIAKKHHVSIKQLKKVNGIKKGDIIHSGATLTIPVNTVNETSLVYTKHLIKKGDNLYRIAAKYNTTVAKLRSENGLKKKEKIIIGQTLKVPQSSQSITITKKKKSTTNKRLASSFSNLKTIKLKEKEASKEKEEVSTFKFSDLFTSEDKKELERCAKLTEDAKKKLGKKYVWGASGTGNTYDCSSFTKYVYRKNGITIPRTSIMQSKHGQYVKREDLQEGDLVFFDTSKKRRGYVNHVGIYLGDNKFIHASSAKKKVVISNLSKFYGQRYKGARRPL